MNRSRTLLYGKFLVLASLAAAGLLLAAAGGWAETPPAPAGGSAAQPAASTDWPQWMGPHSNDISTEIGWQTDWTAHPPKVLWKKSVGTGFSIVSVVGNLPNRQAGRVYTTGNAEAKDTVFCLNADTGEEIWKFSYPCELGDRPGTRCTPVIDGPLLYTLSREGDLFCLDAAAGTKKWTVNVVRKFGADKPMWGFGTHPVVMGDKLILTVGPVLCLDKTSGELIWKSGTDKGGYSSAAIFKYKDKTLISTMVEDGLLVVDAADGKEVARFPWPTTPYRVHVVTPIIDSNRLFFSSGYGMGWALVELCDDCMKEIWRTKNMKNHAANSVLYKGYLYGFDGDVDVGVLACVDFKTGEKKWAQADIKAGSLMIADGKLVVMSSKGDLVLAEAKPESYKELGRLHVLDGGSKCWTMPVLSGGRVFCRNQAGDLVCLSVRSQ